MRADSRALLICAAALGFASVALGAFGAHGLEDSLTPDARDWWNTATFYALSHAIAALAIALSGRAGLARLGGWLFLAGAAIFAGTLYAMGLGAPRMLGAVTPVGGVLLLAGWAMCLASAIRR